MNVYVKYIDGMRILNMFYVDFIIKIDNLISTGF